TRISYMPTNTSPHELKSRPASEVEVFTTGSPTRPYVEVGLIEAQQENQYSTDSASDVFMNMRAEAGQQGCDALIVTGTNNAGGVLSTGTNVSSGVLKGYRGTCVAYTGAAAAAAQPAPATVQPAVVPASAPAK